MQIAAQQQAESYEQHHAQRNLARDQTISQTPRGRPARRIGGRIFQTFIEIHPRSMQRRNHPESQSGQKRHHQTDDENTHIHL